MHEVQSGLVARNMHTSHIVRVWLVVLVVGENETYYWCCACGRVRCGLVGHVRYMHYSDKIELQLQIRDATINSTNAYL